MYNSGKVIKVIDLTPRINSYIVLLKKRIKAVPGQFIMLWIPGIGEIPLSIADIDGMKIELIIAKKGRVTSYIHKKIKDRDKVFIRGPYGHGFKIINGVALLVGGGYGLAPLLFLSKKLKGNKVIHDVALGFRNKEEVFYTNKFKDFSRKVYVSTDDGSIGFKGYVTDLVKDLLNREKYNVVYVCGKEVMEVKVVRECIARNIHVEVSLERLIKCGIGICGSCHIGSGLLVCKDGPVFDGDKIINTEFGKFWRLSNGRKVSIK